MQRTSEALQACLERAPQAKHYYSDAFPVYDTLYYGAPHEMRTDKDETYSVEAVNADLRHYLKRLARKSRCFSRRLQALVNHIRLFVYCYNQRQLAKRRFPKNLSEKELKEETKPDRTGLATIHLTKVTSPCQRIAQNQKVDTECRASCGSY